MHFDPFAFTKAVVVSLAKIFKMLLAAHTDLRKKRLSDQAAAQKVIAEGIKKYPSQTALGGYLRRLKERETIRVINGLPVSEKEVPAFYHFVGESHANERDLQLAWPHRTLTPEGTFDFFLGPFDHLIFFKIFVQTLLYTLSDGCLFLLAALTPKLSLLQACGLIGLGIFLIGSSALPMYLSRSVRAAKRILYRRRRGR